MPRKKTSNGNGSFEIPQIERKLRVERKFKLTSLQQEILSAILDDKTNIVIINGPAGTSKTYIAMYAALQELLKSNEKAILYVRSAIESCSKGLGHLPGTIDEKFWPYTMPLMDKLGEFLKNGDINYVLDNEIVQAVPINYLRGADWKDKIVIVDEAQNITKNELITVLTRISEGSKLIMCGDSMQPDINDNGFMEIINIFSDNESEKMGILSFEFDEDDIVRSEIVKFIIKKLKIYA
jgi:phosphate starvation-inducible PhoH-like protein